MIVQKHQKSNYGRNPIEIKLVPGLVKKPGYKGITQSILVARTPAMSQNGSKYYF